MTVVKGGNPRHPPPRKVAPTLKPPAPPSYKSIVDLAHARKDLSIAYAVLKKTAGPDFGPNSPPATVFLPNNEAFKLLLKALGVNEMQLLSLPTKVLTELVVYHAVPGKPLAAKDLKAKQVVETALDGYNLTITKDSAGVMVLAALSKARVLVPDLKAGKTIVHIVDTVLVPFDVLSPPVTPGAFDTPGGALMELGLESLYGAIEAAGLDAVLNRTDVVGTLFAPTDDAFERMQLALANTGLAAQIANPQVVQMILGDHVHLGQKLLAADVVMRSTIPVGWDATSYTRPDAHLLTVTFNPAGPSVTLSGFPGSAAKVVKADVLVGPAQGLVIHVVDGVLITTATAKALGLIPANQTAPANQTTPSPKPAPTPSPSNGGVVPVVTVPSLAAALAGTLDLSTLLSKAVAAGFANQTQIANMPLTMFAPVNSAWTAFEAMLRAKDPRLVTIANQLTGLIVNDHIHIGDAYNANALTNGQVIPMGGDPTSYMQPGAPVARVAVNSSGVFVVHEVSGAKVLRTIVAGPTVVNVIDSVMLSRAAAAALGLLALPSASPSPRPNVEGQTLLSVLSTDPALAGVMQLVVPAGLDGAFANPNAAYTLFAPVTQAVAAFGKELTQIQTLNPTNPKVLTLIYQVLATHLYMGGVLRSGNLTDGQVITTGAANTPAFKVNVTKNGTGTYLTASNTVKVIAVDVPAGKSIIHKLDGVLLSPEAGMLIIELLGGGGGAGPTPSPSGGPAPSEYGNVLAALAAADDLEGFGALLGVTGQLQQLSSANLVATFFAPTNDALGRINSTVSAIANPELMMQLPQLLSELIGAHVHIGTALAAADLTDGKKIPVGVDPAAYSAAGAVVLTVIVNSTGTFLQSGNIVMVSRTTIKAGKSYIHVIEDVILSPKVFAIFSGAKGSSPAPSPAEEPSPTPSGGFSTVRQALQGSIDLMAFNGMLTYPSVAAKVNDPNFVATVFVPNTDAFRKSQVLLSSIASTQLTSNPTLLLQVMDELLGPHFHVGEALAADDLSVDGKKIPVGLNPATYSAADATVLTVIVNATGTFLQSSNIVMVTSTSIKAGKSMIHVIEDIILSPRLLALLPPPGSAPEPSPEPSPEPEQQDPTYDDLPSALRGEGFNHLADMYDAAVASSVGGIMQGLLAAPITLFAPSDTLIDEHLSGQGKTFSAFLAEGTANPLVIAGLVVPHIHIGNAYTLDDMVPGMAVATSADILPMFKTTLTVTENDTKVIFSSPGSGAVTVVGGVIYAGSATIIPVDKVLLPDP
ncbi:hypothetical protein HYH02_008604 [Chlamydomonas schloesseri]|uniref:FAS1 domain-containing protein n=1 Tax=Chlamydomonas schloesseri TaxID=2026947 RepID=A0A835WD10_9CHLO|nr:hypothetical protein HYH02_008604 [Chlamydomonas schloesseri]|eukprot:KAG2445136.1 hypothetical protein HYH02_008604 [Chlamydomonas schloesseri]